MPELSEELSFLLTSAREAAAAGKNLNIDPGYVLEVMEVMQAARTAIEEMQTAHESQLTRMAKERARLQRKVDRLSAVRDRVAALAERWENATDLGTGSPSIVAAAFAREVRNALEETPNA